MSNEIDTLLGPEFVGFPKIARLSREVIITEKIDGTNAQLLITDDAIHVGSRKRWITPKDDNFGFATWVRGHEEELRGLGNGRHFGEWWGKGIQRGYGLVERRFSLFNTMRWCLYGEEPQRIITGDPNQEKYQEVLPECVGLVPELYRGEFYVETADACLDMLEIGGSKAAPGFMKPEGVVVFHTAANVCFKKTLGDDGHKGAK